MERNKKIRVWLAFIKNIYIYQKSISFFSFPRLNYDNVKSSLLHTRTLDPFEEGCAVDINYFDNGKFSF